ncbi:MAG: TlpA disulfide reductase family protein [Phycisphaerae bacterium]|nr:TlpA disulfide reductase family protein [Phycisphaerae bacterium]
MHFTMHFTGAVRLSLVVGATLSVTVVPCNARDAAPTPATAQDSQPAPVDAAVVIGEFTELVRQIQAAMPGSLSALREPQVRAAVAPKATPVLRSMLALLDAHAVDQPGLAGYRSDYAFYGVVLGDEVIVSRVRTAAGEGDETAAVQLAAAAIMTAPDAAAREAAVDSTVKLLEGKTKLAAGAMSTFSTMMGAAGLTAGELQKLHDTAKAAKNTSLQDVCSRALRDPMLKRTAMEGHPLTLSGKLVDGTTFTTRSLQGKVVLIDFWATWCAPCVGSLPKVVELKKQFGDKGFVVVGVSCDKTAAALKSYLAKNPQLDWPQLFDASKPGWHVLADRCHVRGIPAMFLLDKQGIVRSADAYARLNELIPKLLAE